MIKMITGTTPICMGWHKIFEKGVNFDLNEVVFSQVTHCGKLLCMGGVVLQCPLKMLERLTNSLSILSFQFVKCGYAGIANSPSEFNKPILLIIINILIEL